MFVLFFVMWDVICWCCMSGILLCCVFRLSNWFLFVFLRIFLRSFVIISGVKCVWWRRLVVRCVRQIVLFWLSLLLFILNCFSVVGVFLLLVWSVWLRFLSGCVNCCVVWFCCLMISLLWFRYCIVLKCWVGLVLSILMVVLICRFVSLVLVVCLVI